MIRRRSSKTAQLVAVILSEMEALGTVLTSPAEYRRVYLEGKLPKAEWDRIQKQRAYIRILRELRRKKHLHDRRQGGVIVVKLSRDTVIVELRRRLHEAGRLLPKGEYVLVMFDFPVGANNARAFLRRVLYESGFRREQLSVWKTDRDVMAEMKALVHLSHMDRWVRVYRVESS